MTQNGNFIPLRIPIHRSRKLSFFTSLLCFHSSNDPRKWIRLLSLARVPLADWEACEAHRHSSTQSKESPCLHDMTPSSYEEPKRRRRSMRKRKLSNVMEAFVFLFFLLLLFATSSPLPYLLLCSYRLLILPASCFSFFTPSCFLLLLLFCLVASSCFPLFFLLLPLFSSDSSNVFFLLQWWLWLQWERQEEWIRRSLQWRSKEAEISSWWRKALEQLVQHGK